MPTLTACRLMVDPPADGAWNMAVDEAILTFAAESELPTLRLYQWERPTLSLGYFQKYDDRKLHLASRDADIVRRLSGGGAIVHDRELTYSLVLPGTHPLARDTQQLVDTVHSAIAQTLSDQLADARSTCEIARCERPCRNDSPQPFLCFQRRACGDLLLRQNEISPNPTDHKIVGSAQRRRRGAVLQHGSILLGRSTAAPEMMGYSDLTGIALSIEKMIAKLSVLMLRKLKFEVRESTLSENESQIADNLLRRRYREAIWTKRC